VALGDLTKQLAQQAIGGSMKDVLDSLRPPDLSRVSETLRTTKPAGPGQAEEVCAVLLGQVQAMQKALREDDELVVLLHAGSETVRVLEFFVPQWNVIVLSGIDTERNVTRVVSHIESVQLVCKVMKVQSPAKPARIGFVLPKPKP
jgi:hypothetical protein